MIEQCSHGSPFLFSRIRFQNVETRMIFNQTSLSSSYSSRAILQATQISRRILILKLFLGKKITLF